MKKRKKRVAAFVLAVVLLVGVCMVPVAAAATVPVYVIGASQRCDKAFPMVDIYGEQQVKSGTLGGSGTSERVTQLQTLPTVWSGEYVFLWANETQEFYTNSYSYISHQIECVDSSGAGIGHYTVGFTYNASKAEIQVRAGSYLKDSNGVFREDFYSGTAISAIEGKGEDGGANLCVEIRLYRTLDNDYMIRLSLYRMELIDGVLKMRESFGRTMDLPEGIKPVRASIKTINSKASWDFVGSDALYRGVGVGTLLACEDQYTAALAAGDAKADEYYQSGLIEGQYRGWDQGYSEGYAECDADYIASGKAIWNIASMPVDILANVLNFNFLGVNVWGLASGLVTVAVVIYALKKAGIF